MKIKYFFSLMLIAIIGFAGCKGKKSVDKNANEVIPVTVQKLQIVSVNEEISASANIEGNKTVKLGFMVAGKINYIAAEEGATIKAGQLLASLDPENYSIAKEMADANLDQAQDEYNRLNIMHNRKSVSESDFSKVSNALKVAKAQQHLQVKNLSDTKLYAPINGVLLGRGTEVGEIIGTGLPLFVVSNIQTVKVNASIPESDLQQIKIGSKTQVYVASLNSTFTGKVTEIGSMAEATTRTFNIKIVLSNPHLLIRPGMTAEVKILSDRKNEMIAVPAEAVLHDLDNTSFVYVADTIKKQAFKRNISLGQISGNNIEVTSGLNPNEIVIVGGQHNLSNGSSIILK